MVGPGVVLDAERSTISITILGRTSTAMFKMSLYEVTDNLVNKK
jgi:hypothetical protein